VRRSASEKTAFMQRDKLLEGVQVARFGARQQMRFGRCPFRRIVYSCGCKRHACACHYPYTPVGGQTLSAPAGRRFSGKLKTV
jgi:hypothetical protein